MISAYLDINFTALRSSVLASSAESHASVLPQRSISDNIIDEIDIERENVRISSAKDDNLASQGRQKSMTIAIKIKIRKKM